jgi:VanZ family protein
VRRRLAPWIGAALWACWIFFASTKRFGSAHTSRFILPFLRWLLPHASQATLDLLHLLIRKCAHIFEYGVLSVLLWLGIRSEAGRLQLRWAFLAVVIAGFYGATDEFHQIFVPGRGASVHDVIIDICGATLAQFVIWLRMRRAPEIAR